jgi:adenylate cyclase
MANVWSDPRLQTLRLTSGLVLFAYAFAHFANHAAGLIGLDAMNWAQDWRIAITRSSAGRVILVMAVLTHIGLGLGKLAARRTLKMPAWEWLQIGTGVLVPALLIPHVAAINYFASQTDYFYSYTSVAYALWPGNALWQSVLLLVVWLHGCIGVNYWLRTKPWYASAQPALLTVAIALPLLALTGFLSAAREAHTAFATPAALAKARSELNWPDASTVTAMAKVRDGAWMIYAGILIFTAAIYAARRGVARRALAVRVGYDSGPTVQAPIGPSLLEISRMHGIPHTSACGGRARCSTCRVRIDRGSQLLEAPTAIERATLQRINAPGNVRLACQLRPVADIDVTRLVTALAISSAGSDHFSPEANGVEKPVAILFLDVRGFTRLSENRLPFDIVFLLNQFFATVGEAIRAENGWIDKYMGDGLMAVFGRDSGLPDGCRQALAAARAIDLALDGLNRRLIAEVAEGIRIGIGIHAGPVVIGRIGDADSAALTVVGSTVNEASRLEALTKEKRCQLIISRTVAKQAGLDVSGMASESIEVRGSANSIDIFMIAAARDLALANRRSANPEPVDA